MSFNTNNFSTKRFRSVLMGSTAMAVGMVFVFGAALPTPAIAETLRWDDANANNNWDQDDDGDGSGGDTGLENWLRGGGAGSPEDFDPGDDAVFEGTTAETITVIEDVSPDSITFSTSGYVINGADSNTNIIFQDHTSGGGGPTPNTIDVVSGTAEIGAVIRFVNDVTVNEAGGGSAGTLILSGANQDLVGGTRITSTITLEGGGLTVAGSGQIGFEDSVVATGGLLTIQGQVNAGGPFIGFDRGTVTVGGTGAGAAVLSLEGGTINGRTTITDDGSAFGRNNAGGDDANFAGGVLLTGGSLTIEDATDVGGDGIVNGETVAGPGGTVTINQFEPASTTPVVLSGNVTNNAGGTVNNGTIDGTATLNGGTFANNGDADPGDPDARITGTVTVNGGVFTNSGDVNGAVLVQGGGAQFNNTGDLDSTLSVSDGAFDNQAGGVIDGTATVSGDSGAGQAGVLTASGGAFNGGIDVQTDGQLIVTGDTGTALDPTSVANNGGTVDVTGGTLTVDLFDQQAGVTNNSSNIVGAVDIAGGEFNNDTGGDIDGAIDISGTGVLNANGGSFQENIDINGGTLNINADFDETAGGAVQTNLNSGQINVGVGTAGPVTFTTDFETAGGTTNIGSMGILDNVDAVDDTILLDAGTLINSGTVLDEVRVVDGGTLGIAGGTFNEGVDAQGGNINVTESSTTDLVNNGSTIAISGTGTLTPGPLTLTGNVTNVSGTIASSGTIDGTLTVTADASGGGAVSQFTQNADTAAGQGVTGQVTVSGADAANQATLLAQGGTFTTGIEVQEFGTVSIGDDTINDPDVTGDVVNNGGTVEITANGQLTGSLTNNEGTSTITTGGILTGPLTITGTEADSTVNVGGVVRANNAGDQITMTDGTLNLNNGADIQVTIIQDGADVDGNDVAGANGGVINANAGFFSAGLSGREGVININGTVGGLVIVEGSDFNINDGGELTGRVIMTEDATIAGTNDGTLIGLLTSQGGVFENNGLIQGPGNAEGDSILVTGGTVNNNEGGDATTTSRVQSGSLVANGGNFTGGVIVEETAADTSTFTVVEDMTGDITNNSMMPVTGDGAVTVNAGTVVTGSLTNNSGLATVNGRITGTVEVAGTAATSEVVTNTGTVIDDQTTVSGGALTANGGTFTGGINATGGTTTVDGAITIGAGEELIADDGAVTITADGVVNGDVASINTGGAEPGLMSNAGTINGDARVSGNRFVNTNNVTGSVTVTDGDATSSGMIGNGVAVSGTGDFTLESGGEITGASTVTGDGDFFVDGGTFNDGVTNNGGNIEVTDSATGHITNTDGTAEIDGIATLTGDFDNGADGSLRLLGTLDGDLENAGGIIDTFGTVEGTTLNTGTGASLNVAVSATFGETVTNQSGATIDIDGTLSGNVSNLAGGTIAADSAVLNGAVTNVGVVDVNSGTFALNGALTNQTGGNVNVNDGTTLTTTSFDNDGGTVALEGTLTNAITNSGNLFFDDGVLAGRVTNESGGLVRRDAGALTFGGGLTNQGVVDVSQDGAGTTPVIGDIVTVNGSLTGGTSSANAGTFVLDVDLGEDGVAADGTGASDFVRVTGGAATGTVNLSFNILATGAEPDNSVLVFDVDEGQANSVDITTTGLPDPGEAVLYILSRVGADTDGDGVGDGDAFITDAVNPGISAIAGSIVLTQSLIGSVINRPSSPFVSGLAYDDPEPCGTGPWVRGIAGQADSSGEIVDTNGSFVGEISADYSGFQGGADLACFNGYFDGWDISIGGIGGLNQGQTKQPVFALAGVDDGSGGVELVLSDVQTSVTNTDFDQTYAGVYLTGALNRFSADLQYRVEQTDFVANNTGLNGSSGLGLTDTEFSSEATTFSGSVSYAIPFGESDITFVPTAGFAYTQVSTDRIVFDNGSSVQVEDFTSETAFVGGTISRTSFSEDGTSALNQFGTVTYYSDFADSPTSVFTDTDSSTRSIVSENLGAYAELSAGLNYLRILPLDAPGGAKQLSASIRGDLRSSEQLDSWGLTGQVRIQF